MIFLSDPIKPQHSHLSCITEPRKKRDPRVNNSKPLFVYPLPAALQTNNGEQERCRIVIAARPGRI